ncbi:MAG: deoxyribodipyrimidine photo-lyase [Chitinophagaceae bacterium]|nr:deoxyribodipyrimidine photo-lyase [Chitinophagaceae bacterium]
MDEITIFWFRRDLRIDDNVALFYALNENRSVLPIFIFDKNLLEKLSKDDKRVQFIYTQIIKLKNELSKLDINFNVFFDTPYNVFEKLKNQFNLVNVYSNEDYEPYAKQRDEEIEKLISPAKFIQKKDQVIFDYSEILKSDNSPYTVYTPYSKKWKEKLNDFYMKEYPCQDYYSSFYNNENPNFISLNEMGFDHLEHFVETEIRQNVIENYHNTRDFPAIEGTSKASVHLRFGTISIRKFAKNALQKNEKFLNELIWRDFYQSILAHFPHVVEKSFKPKYDFIEWRNNEEEFRLWCEGNTGYPIVDAGMRELNATGWMHNRVRMIVASFLCKHLLIDWRWGEAYFAEKLMDFDLASNNGGWQWAAGSGVDAAPYFRIFNPYLQTQKFDKDFIYIKKWVPEYNQFTYPKPIVEHEFARERCLKTYKNYLN